jgi:hypothetical protein
MVAQRETVVLVHGLYVHGLWMQLLEYWLEEAGYQTVNYSYPSITRSPAENAEDLHKHAGTAGCAGRAFSGAQHGWAGGAPPVSSLPQAADGPDCHDGHAASGQLRRPDHAQQRHGLLCGRGLEDALLGDAPTWDASRQLGSIAGTLNIGLCLLFPGMPEPSDGMIAVVETQLPGMSDHICLPVSHMQMLVDPVAVTQACAFFATGRFRHSSRRRTDGKLLD